MIHYIVQPGDSLYKISKKFNVSMDEIVRVNGIHSPHMIFIGQSLMILLSPRENNSPSELPHDVHFTKEGLLLALNLDRGMYAPGERIFFTLSKLNTSNQTITLHYSTSQRYDLLLTTAAGLKITQWSDAYSFLQKQDKISLAIAESHIYTESYQLPRDLPRGQYIVIGWDTAQELRSIRLSIPFQVK